MPIKDLNDLYDGGGEEGDGDVKIPPVDRKDYDPIKAYMASKQGIRESIHGIGNYSGLDTEPYVKAFDRAERGIPDPTRTGLDINNEMGYMQSAWDKWGNWLVRATAKIGTGLVGAVGYLGALVSEGEDNRDYRNALTDLNDKWDASLDKALPIYGKVNDTFSWRALGDMGWWLNNTESLASSVASFALVGAGVAKVVGLVGKLTKGAELLEGITGSARAGNVLAQGITASTMAYVEGAQMGNRVYKEVYQTQLEKGLATNLTPEEAHERARHFAAQSAATTVQINTVLGTMTNMYSVLPFFNTEEQIVERIARKKFPQMAGESLPEWKARLSNYTMNDFKGKMFGGGFVTQGRLAATREAFMEGLEELNNNFAQYTGSQEGNDGRIHGFWEQFGQISKYFDRTMDADGALNFVMGAIAGPLTNIITTNIPMHKVQVGVYETGTGDNARFTDKKGVPLAEGAEPIKKFKVMTSRSKNNFGNTNYFNDIKDAVSADIDYYMKKNKEIEVLRSRGEHEKAELAVQELFDTSSRRSVALGFADNLRENFSQIASMDNKTTQKEAIQQQLNEVQTKINNGDTSAETVELKAKLENDLKNATDKTEAMRRGFTASKEDNSFKDKAEEAIADLEHLKKLHEETYKKYNTGSHTIGDSEGSVDPLRQHVADFIFDRKARIYTLKKQAKKWDERLAQIQVERDALNDIGTEEELQADYHAEVEYSKLHARYKALGDMLDAEQAALLNAQKNPTRENVQAAMHVLEKHGELGVTAEDVPAAIKSRLEKNAEKGKKLTKNLENANEKFKASLGYLKWLEKNPGKTIEDYIEKAQKRTNLSAEEASLLGNREQVQSLIDSQTDNLAELEKARTMNKIMKSTQRWWDKLAEERKRYQQEQITEDANRKIAMDKAYKRNKGMLLHAQKGYIQDLKNIQERIDAIKQKIEEIKLGINEFKNSEGIVSIKTDDKLRKYQSMVNEIHDLQKQLHSLIGIFNSTQAALEDINKKLEEFKEEPKKPVIKEDNPPDIAPDPITPEVKPEPEPELEPEVVPEKDTEKIPEEEEKIDTTTGDKLESAVAAYEKLKNALPKSAQKMLEEREKQLRLKEIVFSLNLLKPYVKNKTITQDQANNVLQALKEMMDAENDMVENLNKTGELAGTITGQNIKESEEEIPEAEVSIEEPDSLVTNLTAMVDLNLPESNDLIFSGMKSIYAASETAGRSIDYIEFTDMVTKQIVKEASKNINPDTHESIFDPAGLLPGTNLWAVVDDKYDGPTNTVADFAIDKNGERVMDKDNFQNYVGKDGKIKDEDEFVGNVPIKLVNEKGETVQYVRTNKWITTTYGGGGGPEGYRNVYDGAWDDPRGITPGNANRQAMENLSFRKMVVERYNEGKENKEGGIMLTVMDKSAGHPIMNIVHAKMHGTTTNWEGKLVEERASVLLPDEALNIGIVQNGVVNISSNYPTKNKIATKLSKHWNNRAVFMLPGLNGQFHLAVATGIPLDANKVAFNTIVRVIELHLLQDRDNKDVVAINARTKFDITTVAGLKGFINQYFTHSEGWAAAQSSNNLQERSILDITKALSTEFNNRILIGTISPFSTSEVTAELQGGKLNEEFKAALKQLLSERLKNVVFTKKSMGIRGINEVTTPGDDFWEPRADSNGKFSFHPHKNYNEYIKKHLKVKVYGKNTITVVGSNGRTYKRYVYAANPTITLNISSVTSLNTKEASGSTLPDPTIKPKTTRRKKGMRGMLEDETKNNVEIINAATVTDGLELTKPNLQKLYNLAGENRNGLTVDEVWESRLQQGLSLQNGFNPFIKCE